MSRRFKTDFEDNNTATEHRAYLSSRSEDVNRFNISSNHSNGMPPAAVQFQNQEGNSNHQYQYASSSHHNSRNFEFGNEVMDAIEERKNGVMQRPAYQHPHPHQHQQSSYNTGSRLTHTSGTRRSRASPAYSSSQNMSSSINNGSSRESRSSRHLKESSRRSAPHSATSSSVPTSSSTRSSHNHSNMNVHVNVNPAHPNESNASSNFHYQQPVHPHAQPNHHSFLHHPAPPQSNSGNVNHYPVNNSNNISINSHNNPSIQSSSQPQTQKRPAYLLHRDLVIGKGSYGQVCIASRGEAEGHGRSGGKRKKFACKCVVLRNDPKYIAKLQEEVNVLRELRGHDNVIRLYDVFCVDNELFIITELGRGGDLFHLLTTHPKHGVTEAYAGKLTFVSW